MAMEFSNYYTNRTDAHIHNSERLKTTPSLETRIQRTPSKHQRHMHALRAYF